MSNTRTPTTYKAVDFHNREFLVEFKPHKGEVLDGVVIVVNGQQRFDLFALDLNHAIELWLLNSNIPLVSFTKTEA